MLQKEPFVNLDTPARSHHGEPARQAWATCCTATSQHGTGIVASRKPSVGINPRPLLTVLPEHMWQHMTHARHAARIQLVLSRGGLLRVSACPATMYLYRSSAHRALPKGLLLPCKEEGHKSIDRRVPHTGGTSRMCLVHTAHEDALHIRRPTCYHHCYPSICFIRTSLAMLAD